MPNPFRYIPRAELVAAAASVAVSVLLLTLKFTAYYLTGSAAIHAARTLRSVAHGFAVLQAGGGFGYPEDLEETFRLLSDTFVIGVRQTYLAS